MFQRFGFGTQTAPGGGVSGPSLADFIKINQQVFYVGGGVFQLSTATSPIVPQTLKVFVNGANQHPIEDFEVMPGNAAFKMLDLGVPWGTAEYSIVVDFIRT